MAKPAEPQQGDVLAGKYRIERRLGKGGMGMVFAATDQMMQRRVAIKLLLPSLAVEADMVERFMREAKACVALTSEHSVRLYDVLETEDGTPFIVMEYLEGNDLGAVVTTRGRVEPFEASDMILQVCEAIAEAHAHGIIHRDLKPQNLFLSQRPGDGRVVIKVLDFGLAKVPVDGEKLTSSNAIMGSPEYMSPEQMRGARFVDTRTDIWALGACLYELLTGRPPFTAPSVPDLVVKILHTPALAPNRVYSDIPEELSAIVLRCLEKEPESRFADVAELSRALEPFGSVASAGAGDRARRLLDTTRPPPLATPVKPMKPVVDVRAPREERPAVTVTNVSVDSGVTRNKRAFWWSAAAGILVACALLVTVLAVQALTRRDRALPEATTAIDSPKPDETTPPVPTPAPTPSVEAPVTSTQAAPSASVAPQTHPRPAAFGRPPVATATSTSAAPPPPPPPIDPAAHY